MERSISVWGFQFGDCRLSKVGRKHDMLVLTADECLRRPWINICVTTSRPFLWAVGRVGARADGDDLSNVFHEICLFLSFFFFSAR